MNCVFPDWGYEVHSVGAEMGASRVEEERRKPSPGVMYVLCFCVIIGVHALLRDSGVPIGKSLSYCCLCTVLIVACLLLAVGTSRRRRAIGRSNI